MTSGLPRLALGQFNGAGSDLGFLRGRQTAVQVKMATGGMPATLEHLVREIDVLDATCQLDFVTVEVLPRETDERGHSRVPVRVTVPADFPSGRHTGLITLHTSDSEFKLLYAAVLVQGQSVIQPVGFEEPEPDD